MSNTLRCAAGVLVLADETVSHLPPLIVDARAEKEATAPLEVLMATLCTAGVLPPMA